MKILGLLGVAAWLTTGVAAAGQNPDPRTLGAGRALFLQHCASCHGTDAKGGGSVAATLTVKVPDLTALAPKNGKFDADRVRTLIDGTQAATAHGTRDMPVWGKVFAAGGEKRGEGWAQTEVWTLVEYLRSLQTPAQQ